MPYLKPQILLIILPMILLGIAFWTGSDLLTKKLLGFSYRTLDKLQADTLPQVELTLNFTVVDMKVEKEQKFTQVKIKTANSLLKRLEIEIPNSNFPEVAIAQKFGLESQQEKLKLNKQIQVKIPVILKVIKAEIQKKQGLSFIEVRTANNTLRKLDFVLPVTEINMVEAMTAKLLNLSPEEVRKLIRYQVQNQSWLKPKIKKAAKTEII
ncbi:hypothetical protein GNF10_27630 [Nostoc sp. UCD121]|uniref:hypothetical protein n=1 Tax=unclassified Nostoc TaxID=2593658 RepID=UPI0016270F07|nr:MULTISPECIES: hypothetical protein [unclassified Nostoc]MBC1222091.1 hypothetical protein [Nostoc sp. UCD120]MBC1279627.1 hypothetical protein [Nostoc sp. UCD121]